MRKLDCFSFFVLIVRQKELLKGFVSKELKGQFAGTMAGSLWTVFTPLATILAYCFVFSLVLRISVTVEETGTDCFVLFFLTGFFPWLMFADSLAKSVTILLRESSLITKVVFPVELLPISVVLSTYIINGIGFLLVLFYLAFTGYIHYSWLYIPFLLIVQILFTLGFSFFLAALNVFLRDTSELLNLVIMLWFFGTPVIYPLSMVPENIKILIKLNPMALFAGMFRDVILIHRFDYVTFSFLALVSILCYGFGSWFFMKAKPAFGDVL